MKTQFVLGFVIETSSRKESLRLKKGFSFLFYTSHLPVLKMEIFREEIM